MGSQRKNGSGNKYTAQIEKKIGSISDAEFEYLFLSDFDIKMCKGCMVCYEKGEAACPLKDDYLAAIRKLLEADAVIIYSPTYTLSISGMLKNFFDRSSYLCHRPLFKGKQAMIMTSVGAYGEKLALDTLNWIVAAIGFKITGKIGVRSGSYDRNPKYALEIDQKLEAEAVRHFGTDTEGCRYDKKY